MTQPARRLPPPLAIAALLVTGMIVVQALLVSLFAWPAANAEPRDLPVVVAGPAAAAGQFTGQLQAALPGGFEITPVADAAAADQALRDRDAYAAFVLGPDGVALHTASAASPTVAALLTQAAARFGNGQPVQVSDVVPTDPDDPRGAGLGAGFLPLVLTCMLIGVAIVVRVRSRAARLFGVVAFAALAGLAGATVLQSWLGVLPDNFLVNAAAIAAFALAASATVAGLGSVFGRPGLGLGALLVFLVGNPLSGITSAPDLLPQPWGEVGQWLPVGAGGTVLRSAAYFDWAGAGHALWVLAGYATVGLVLIALAPVFRPAPAEQPRRARPASASGALAEQPSIGALMG